MFRVPKKKKAESRRNAKITRAKDKGVRVDTSQVRLNSSRKRLQSMSAASFNNYKKESYLLNSLHTKSLVPTKKNHKYSTSLF